MSERQARQPRNLEVVEKTETVDEYVFRVLSTDESATNLDRAIVNARWSICVPCGRYRNVPVTLPSNLIALGEASPELRVPLLWSLARVGNNAVSSIKDDTKPLPEVQAAMQKRVNELFASTVENTSPALSTLYVDLCSGAFEAGVKSEEISAKSVDYAAYADLMDNFVIPLASRNPQTVRYSKGGTKWLAGMLAYGHAHLTKIDEDKAKKAAEKSDGKKGRTAKSTSFFSDDDADESDAAE